MGDETWTAHGIHICTHTHTIAQAQASSHARMHTPVQAAEVLQLYLELCCDVSERAARWRRVSCVLRARDEGWDAESAKAVLMAMVLTRKERDEFK